MVFGDYAISSFNDQKHAAKGDLGRLGARKEGFMSKQSKKLTRQEKLEQKDKAYEERLKNRQEKALAALSDQEEEIHDFCSSRYGITFPQFAKIEVLGENAHPLFKWLSASTTFEGFNGPMDKVRCELSFSGNPNQ